MPELDVGGTYTLVDLVKMLDPSNGRLLFVANVLARKNDILKSAPIVESNQVMSHVGSRVLSLPTVSKRAINDGVAMSAHKEVQIAAPMALFETMSQIDEETLALAGRNAEGVRQRRDSMFIEALGQAVATDIIYGSVGANSLGFNGLATLFNSKTARPNGDTSWPFNVWDNGATGSSTTSIYAMEWGIDKVHLIYPSGTKAGIEINDLGRQVVSGMTANTRFVAYITQFKWRCGLFVADERCAQRVANVATTGTSNTFSDDILIGAINSLPSMGADPMTRIYVNRTIRTQMDIRLKDKTNVNYTSGADAFGKPVLYFRGIPVEVCDAILNTETAI